jgi:hypothetical protein
LQRGSVYLNNLNFCAFLTLRLGIVINLFNCVKAASEGIRLNEVKKGVSHITLAYTEVSLCGHYVAQLNFFF